MRIAYCILCHRYTPVLRELVGFVGADNDVFVHVDAKCDMADFAPLADKVNFVGERVGVSWGRYSQIEATLRLLDATRASRCDYVAFVSGDTLPLRTDAELKRFLWENRGREFVFESPVQRHHIDRVRYRYPELDPRDCGRAARMWYALRRRLKLLPRNRWFDALPPIRFGPNWFVITPALRDYIFDYLGQHPEYAEAFRRSHCGDELFFATIVSQSPFKAARDNRRTMYTDWQTGPQFPRTLDTSDFDRMKAALARDGAVEHYLFARKFADGLDLDEYRKTFL